jgi:vacuolar-type H+-ATPase subunit H
MTGLMVRRGATSLLVLIGSVAALAGCGSDDKAKEALDTAHTQAQKIVADATKQARQNLLDAQGQIERDRKAAQSDLEGMRGQIGDERGKLSDAKHDVSAERSKLSKLRGQVAGARQQVARNTVDGTGTFVVGSDITPGTYRATAQPGCYWARLSSLDTSDIVDNDNADGPVVVEILPSDKAFQVSDCADFHKVG